MTPPLRKLIVTDLENLGGCNPREATPALYDVALASLRQATRMTDNDLMIIGVNPRLAFIAHTIAPTARIVTRGGPHGAELRLLDELTDPVFIARRFSEVVIASGDGAFLEAIIELNRVGLKTTVATLPGHISTAIRLAAHTTMWLPNPLLRGEAA